MYTFTANIVVLFYIVAAVLSLVVVLGDRKKLESASLVVLGIGLVGHMVALGGLIADSGAGSLLDIQHSLSVLAFLLGGGFLLVRKLYGLGTIASFVVPLMVLLQSTSVLAAPEAAVSSDLRGPLLALHIAMALLGTAAFVLAALTSVFYLIQDRNLKRKKFGPLFNRLPSIDVLDRANMRLVSIGFTIYTVAIALGGFFAWDNSASLQLQYFFAIASWAIYAGIINARITIGWRGRRAAALTLLGLVGLGAVLSTYLAGSGAA